MNINKKTYKYAKQLQDEVGLNIESVKNESSQNYINHNSRILSLEQSVNSINQTITNLQTTHTNDIQQLNSNSEKTINKTTTLNSSSTHTQYPSAKSVYDAIINLGGSYNDAQLNTTYLKSMSFDSVGKIKYFQIGKMVIIHFNNIYFNAVNFSNNTIFASGLPNANKEVVSIILGDNGTIISVKICEGESSIKSNCSLTPYDSEPFCGFLIYLTQ